MDDDLNQLYENTLEKITSHPDHWMAFLRAVSMNYKLRFDELVMIYAQNPHATAVLDIDGWNKYFGRYVEAGSEALAVFDEIGSGVKYYFDVSDTRTVGGETEFPKPWAITKEVLTPVVNQLNYPGFSLPSALITTAETVTDEYVLSISSELLETELSDSLFELDIFDLQNRTTSLIKKSVEYLLLYRCGVYMGDKLSPTDFNNLELFHSAQTSSMIGSRVINLSRNILSGIANTIRVERRKNEYERGANYGIQESRRLSNTTVGNTAQRDGGANEVRENEIGVSKRASSGAVRHITNRESISGTPEGNSGNSRKENGVNHNRSGTGAGRERSAEGERPNGLGTENEHDTSRRRRNNQKRNDLQLISNTQYNNEKEADQNDVPLFSSPDLLKSKQMQIESISPNVPSILGVGSLLTVEGTTFRIILLNSESVIAEDISLPLIQKIFTRKEFDDTYQPEVISEESEKAVETLSDATEEEITEEALPFPIPENYIINPEITVTSGPKAKFAYNMTAVSLLKQLENEKRGATPEEQKILSRYVGFGGLADAFDSTKASWSGEYSTLKEVLSPTEYIQARASTLNAHYTPPFIIEAVYDVIDGIGCKADKILDPALGSGRFFGLLPSAMKNSELHGVELDSITGQIAKQLYPSANIQIKGFEETNFPDNSFDLVVGNVPFGNYGVADSRYNKNKFLIHDYFFAKSLDKVRPGGVVALITSKGTLDKETASVRKYLAERAELIGAIRLPSNAFSSAGTEVTTDIIFLQKRNRAISVEPNWVYVDKDTNGISVNSYFVEHPEMILGEMVMESTAYGMDSTCRANKDETLPDLLSRAVLALVQSASIYNEIAQVEDLVLDDEPNTAKTVPADAALQNYSFSIFENGIFFKTDLPDMEQVLNLSETAKQRIIGMVSLRDSCRSLIEYQMEDYPESQIQEETQKLNSLYDQFQKKYGCINDRVNKTAFKDDSSYLLLCSLEILDEHGKFLRKSDIFSKRTIFPKKEIVSAANEVDALYISVAEKACVDLPYIASLVGKTEKDIPEIIENLKGQIFKDPLSDKDVSAGWQTADEYLSGNIRKKLFIAQEYSKNNTSFEVNVKALQDTLPEPLSAANISIRLGSFWIPEEVIKNFIIDTLSPSGWVRNALRVRYLQTTSEWEISPMNSDFRNVNASSVYGTGRINAYQIIENTLNLRNIRIYDKVWENGKEKRVLNKKETAIAMDKQDKIKNQFSEWVWKDPERREQLEKKYNELFNSEVERVYDGSYLRFEGMNSEFELDTHQSNAVARALFGGNTLLGHVVGAGKTFTMCAIAMKAKQLGLSQKSMIVVPNNIVGDFSKDFMKLYPAANILMTTAKDFETKNRKKLIARIATGDFDAVIIAHSQFTKIPLSYELQKETIQMQIDSIMEGIEEVSSQNGERFTVKALEKIKKNLEVRLERLNDQSNKDTDILTFDQLGVDRLFVDEADMFKNLFLATKMTNVGGIAQTDSQKASDLFTKTRYLDKLTGNKGVVFATGTMISNTMAELYTMQRYLAYDDLRETGLEHFDAWASTFGETVTALELSPDGSSYRQKTRFARFFNLPELMTMIRRFTDIQTEDMLNLPTPNANYHTVSVKPSSEQKEMVQELAERADRIHNRQVTPNEDNMLLVTNDGRKLALDQRIIDCGLPDFEGSKVNMLVENVFSIWQETASEKSTQLIFSDISTPGNDRDMFSVYTDIQRKLVEKGVPESEFSIIHNVKTENQKVELFAKVRSGSVRILMGSTFKMGAGTNVQDKLKALHDLDCPWRPRDLEQRRGRIVRRGNTNSEVDIYRYVTEGTFDAYLYQMIENKQRFISQVFTSKSPSRVMEEVDDASLKYAEIKALATGNPLIIERCELENDVNMLKTIRSGHLREQYRLSDEVRNTIPDEIKGLKSRLKFLEEDLLLAGKTDESDFSIELFGKTYTDPKEAGKKLIEAAALGKSDVIEIGSYRGFKISIAYDNWEKESIVSLSGSYKHNTKLSKMPSLIIPKLDALVNDIANMVSKNKLNTQELEKRLTDSQQNLNKPFPRESELVEKEERLKALTLQLELDRLDNEVADDSYSVEKVNGKEKVKTDDEHER